MATEYSCQTSLVLTRGMHWHPCVPAAVCDQSQGRLLSSSVKSVFIGEFSLIYYWETLQHHTNAIMVTEGIDHKGRALSRTHLGPPQHALRRTPTLYKLRLKTDFSRHTVLDQSTSDPTTTRSNARLMSVVT